MIYGFNASERSGREELAAITTDIRIRVLNVSPTGVLVEANRPIDIGSAATLRITATDAAGSVSDFLTLRVDAVPDGFNDLSSVLTIGRSP